MSLASRVKSLFIEFGVDTSKVKKGFDDLSGTTEKATGKISKAGSMLTKIFVGGAIAFGIKKITDFAIEQEGALKQLETVIKSTGGVAGLTSKQLQDMASGLQSVTTYGDEAIMGAESLLLTFKNVGEKVFPTALESILNVSTAMGQDLKTSAIQIGKVLNDPIANMGALSRAGIQFTDDQKKMIKEMQSSGQIIKAQEIILKELESQFGGSARAAADTFGGALKQTENIIGDFFEEVGKGITENDTFKESLVNVQDVFKSKEFAAGIASIISLFASFIGKIIEATAGLIEFLGQSARLESQLSEQAKDFESSFNMIYNGLLKAGVGFETLNKAIDDIPSGNKIKELGNRQSELNEIIKKSNETMAKSKPLDIAYEGAKVRLAKATKELNKVTADRNFLLSQGIQEIVKNAKAYGISEKAVDKMRASLRGEIEEKVKAIEATKKHTESKVEEKKTIEELHKVTQAARLAVDDFKISENDLELSAGETKKALDREKTSIEEQKKALLEAEKAAKKHADALRMIVGGLNILSSLKGVPEDLAAGFSTLSSVVQSMASGDVIGAVTAGVQFLTTQFGKDGLSGGIELATDLLRKFGVTGEEVIKKLADQLNELAKKMSMADAMDAAKDGLQDFFDEANKMAEEAAKGTAEYYEKAFDAISPLEDFLSGGANSQEEFNSQVQITLGLFANMLKSGASITEVLSAMGDSFDKLIESQEKNKWAADDTFEALKNFRKLIKDNEDLVRSVEGFNKVLEITAGLGDMNQKQFDSYAKSATSQYDKLIKAGFSQAQALQMLGPSLKTLKDQADKFGLTIDDNTKKLIDQADKSGVFDDMADPLDNIADILTKIYELLGGTTDEMGNLGDKAEITGVDIGGKLGEAAAKGMDDALKKSGLENIDLTGNIPDLGTLTIDTKQMEALLAKDTSKEKDMKDLVKIELGPRTQNNYWQPQTINTRDMEDAMSKNPKGFADIIRSYV